MSSGHALTCSVNTFTVLAWHTCVFVEAQHSKMCSLNTVMSVSVSSKTLIASVLLFYPLLIPLIRLKKILKAFLLKLSILSENSKSGYPQKVNKPKTTSHTTIWWCIMQMANMFNRMITVNIDSSPELCPGFEKMSPYKSFSITQMKSSRIYFEKIGSIKVTSFWKSRSLFGPYYGLFLLPKEF